VEEARSRTTVLPRRGSYISKVNIGEVKEAKEEEQEQEKEEVHRRIII